MDSFFFWVKSVDSFFFWSWGGWIGGWGRGGDRSPSVDSFNGASSVACLEMNRPKMLLDQEKDESVAHKSRSNVIRKNSDFLTKKMISRCLSFSTLGSFLYFSTSNLLPPTPLIMDSLGPL